MLIFFSNILSKVQQCLDSLIDCGLINSERQYEQPFSPCFQCQISDLSVVNCIRLEGRRLMASEESKTLSEKHFLPSIRLLEVFSSKTVLTSENVLSKCHFPSLMKVLKQ